MFFDVEGPFEYQGSFNRQVDYAEFWKQVETKIPDLSKACGCYLFGVRAGKGVTPWYVGKAEKQPFTAEVFNPHKIVHYNAIMEPYSSGTPVMYLIPRMTPNKKFSRPGKNGHKDIEFLETYLIISALRANPCLENVSKTRIAKNISVPGIIGSTPGSPKSSVKSLKTMLNL